MMQRSGRLHFSMNNTAANLYLALMGYISYYANSMAGFSVVLISSLVTAMNILMV